ncbi:MAG: TIGR03013 family XrtA/PEP-CTERM system glycosyltransferase [Planctomycetota bacterium]
MLHVLRHYLPVRKALLIGSELALLTILVFLGMSSHLWWDINDETLHRIAVDGLSTPAARWRCLISAFMVAVAALVTIGFNELYDFRISSSRYDRASRFLGSAGSAILFVVVIVGIVQAWDIDRILDFPGLPFTQKLVVLVTTLMVGFTLLYLWRHVFHFMLRRFSFNERLMILGTGPMARRLADELRVRDDSGYSVIAMIAPSDCQPAPAGERRRWSRPIANQAAGAEELRTESAEAAVREPRISTLLLEPDLPEPDGELRTAAGKVISEPIHELAANLKIDDIVVALEDRRGILPTQDLLRCRLGGIEVEEAETIYERVAGKIAVEAMRPSYLIFNRGFAQHPLGQVAKRMLDLALALLVFAVTWPFMILTAIAIRLDSPGPVLYRQERSGLNGEPFTLNKFRSMRQDAESGTGPVWASEGDPRITKVGRFIRKTRLDELPQLFNVLGGSMSMIGPRPERPNFVADLSSKIPYFEQRHIVKPGLTGWAQINYPYGNTVEDASQKLQYDLFYIKYQSLLFDLSILFHTIKTVVLRKGT